MISTLTLSYDIYLNFIKLYHMISTFTLSSYKSHHQHHLSIFPSIYQFIYCTYLSHHYHLFIYLIIIIIIVIIIITFLIRFGYGLIRVIRTVIYTAYKSILRISFVGILMVILIKGGFYILVRIHDDWIVIFHVENSCCYNLFFLYIVWINLFNVLKQ